jgi:hypothetical protein
MCMGGTPKMTPPPPPEAPKEAPKMVDANVQAARTDEKAAARAAAGRSGNIKTDPAMQAQDPNTAKRTLLG